MSSSPLPAIWPPKRPRLSQEHPSSTTTTPLHHDVSSPSTPATTYPPLSLSGLPITYNTPQGPLAPPKTRKIYRNGYESKPKTPSYTPYRLNNPGHSRQKAFAFSGFKTLTPMEALSSQAWNELALTHGELEEGQRLREFQIEACNVTISRQKDMCVIAPTGSGKSLLWVLPLLVQKSGISVVIVPYTSLGHQGERRHSRSSVRCTFLHSNGERSNDQLKKIAEGGDKSVIFTCVEMLETPAVAQVIHSESFQAQLSGVYIDEAHVLHESHSWRPSYSRLYNLRTIIGTKAPLICISATLPKRYRDTIQLFAGLRPDYHLINLGNHRPELSTIISPMEYPATSFQDLAFIVPWNSTPESIKQTIVYSDDLELLTSMFWWFHTRLGSMNLPITLLDILHAGLSESHQEMCTNDFIAGKSKILLGSDKIGAGMDFPNVTLVVQYRCRGLTIVRWEQRRGRGARREGMSSLGIILVEKSMIGRSDHDVDSLSAQHSKSEDPGILDLIQTRGCQEVVVDRWLENPPRESTNPLLVNPLCGRCSNCNPQLQLLLKSNNLSWVMEDPRPLTHKSGPRGTITDQQKAIMISKLQSWRLSIWKENWKEKWPSYGPEDLVSNTDIQEIVKKARTLNTIDDIDAITQIPHLEDLGHALLFSIKLILFEVAGIRSAGLQTESENLSATTPSTTLNLQWTEPQVASGSG